MKECMKALEIDEKMIPLKSVLGEISRAKDRLCGPDEFSQGVGSDYRLERIAGAYRLYQSRLKEADAMDFDDLLYYMVSCWNSARMCLPSTRTGSGTLWWTNTRIPTRRSTGL